MIQQQMRAPRLAGQRSARLLAAVAAGLAGLAIGACGSSGGGSATGLLKQTFSGSHRVDSGNLQFSLRVTPSGSSTLTTPITLAFGGPFQSLGTGKLPASDFTVSISANGSTGSLAILSTGTKGYITMSGTSYQMPASSFQKLESSFSRFDSSSGSGKNGSVFSKLGINPLGWVRGASVIGSESVGGADTTHISARLDVASLLRDLSTFLSKSGSLHLTGSTTVPSSISPTTQAKIAHEVQSPRFDVWTGNGDRTVRKLVVDATVPVSGQTAALLGGIRSAEIALSIQYSNLNQPQTITAPTSTQPYSVFTTKLRTLITEIENGVASGALGGGSGTGTAGSSGAGTTGGGGSTTSSSGASAYGRCISAARSDVAKMQKCASLLNK